MCAFLLQTSVLIPSLLQMGTFETFLTTNKCVDTSGGACLGTKA